MTLMTRIIGDIVSKLIVLRNNIFNLNVKVNMLISGKLIRKPHLIIIQFLLIVFIADGSFSQTAPNISPTEFTKIIRDMSEDNGYFRGESWVTNELTYLDVIESIDKYNIRGGAYIGVAPEQNFTYMAVIKPQIAFLVDIRAQNRMQHLMFKIMFEISETRIEFLSNLFSMPLQSETGIKIPNKDSDINLIVNFLENSKQSRELFNKNLSLMISVLNNKYKFKLTDWERSNIKHVYEHFYTQNLNMTNGPWRSSYPTLGEIFTDRDKSGRQLNVFNSREKYLFIRKMQLENKVIPITGDYGNNYALSKVAAYLKKHKLTVSAQYVSNAEQYIIRNRSNWNNWVSNIKNMPYNDKTVFIRWLNWNYYEQDTKLQYFKTFIKNNESGIHSRYFDLISNGHLK